MWKSPPGKPQFLKRKIVPNKKLYYSIHRPWSTNFQYENWVMKRRDWPPVEPIKDWSFFRGDRVCIYMCYIKGFDIKTLFFRWNS